MKKTFPTPHPVSLHVELGAGRLAVTLDETDSTTIAIEGDGADECAVEQRGDRVVVVAPSRRSTFGRGTPLDVNITGPAGCTLWAKTGSADVTVDGPAGGLQVKSGSGAVRADHARQEAVISTGSGDVSIGVAGASLRVKTGSGNVRADDVSGSAVVSCGSGDVHLGSAHAETAIRAASGDIEVSEAHAGLTAGSASGDVTVGRISSGGVKVKCVSGDVHLGVAPGVPVWTDVSSVSGKLHSDLVGAGKPEDGQGFIEIRATTVSGDVYLQQL